MKRRLQILILAIFLLSPVAVATLPAQVSAIDIFQTSCTGSTGTAANTDVCKEAESAKTSTNPVISALRIVISVIAIIIGIAAVIVIILAGFTLITSNGDAQAVAKARTSIIYALVGIVVAVLAGTIVAFVIDKL